MRYVPRAARPASHGARSRQNAALHPRVATPNVARRAAHGSRRRLIARLRTIATSNVHLARRPLSASRGVGGVARGVIDAEAVLCERLHGACHVRLGHEREITRVCGNGSRRAAWCD